LNWQQSGKWTLQSDNGGYMVTKYIVNGKPVYQAIKRPATSLLVADSADKCKAACEADNG
jgi:hypothetical protein